VKWVVVCGDVDGDAKERRSSRDEMMVAVEYGMVVVVAWEREQGGV
jgi:hypothetical protein